MKASWVRCIALAVGAALTLTIPSFAQSENSELVSVSSDLGKVGWQFYSFRPRDMTRFVGSGDGVIKVTTTGSAGFLYRGVIESESEGRFISWRWRVDENMDPTDLESKGKDDRPLALHLLFPFRPGQIGLATQLSSLALAGLINKPISGKMITYVWGGKGNRGDMIDNPYRGSDGVLIILRTGNSETGEWQSETVDFAADFERAFGFPAESPTHIVISGDSDDTNSRSVGLIGAIRFREEK